MRKTIMMLVLLVMALQANSQEMLVKGFRSLPGDLTAMRQGTSMVDNNGLQAALIKIVAPGKDYIFDGGSLGIVGTSYHGGEIWVYVPDRSQKITISHPKYGVLRDYYYSEAIKAGQTYEMLLDPGVGKFMNITSNQAGADIYIDNDSIGRTPLANTYLIYGKHHIQLVKGKMLGDEEVDITSSSSASLNIAMKDMSSYYGTITVNVPGDAAIFYEGKKVGVGSWSTELFHGEYSIETRKENCESRFSTISVKPGYNSPVTIEAPVPYKGYLRIQVLPHSAALKVNKQNVENGSSMQLPVGTAVVEASRNGYLPVEKTYTINRGIETSDTVRLGRISYIKSTQFYFGAGYEYNTLSGIGGLIGVTYKNFDLQLSYTFGLNKTKELSWYNSDDNSLYSTMKYSQNRFAAKLGYQLKAASRCAITPQVGYSLLSLKGERVEGSGNLGDGATANCLSVGAKVVFVPFHHFGIFVNPEYAFAVSKDDDFDFISNKADFTIGGFFGAVGVIVNF